MTINYANTKGMVCDNAFAKSLCGHVIECSRAAIVSAITGHGFRLVEQFIYNGFVIYNVAIKP